MDKAAVVYIQWHITQPTKGTSESVLIRWMNQQPIIQSELSQKEKNKYHTLTHIYGICKMILMNPFSGPRWRHRQREWTDGHGGSRGGRRGGMCEESNMETYITIHKIDRQWEFAVRLGKLKLRLCNNLEDGEQCSRARGHLCTDSC